MDGGGDSSELAAARLVARVLRGRFTITDTGAKPGQHDAQITTTDGRTIALEVTSYRDQEWAETRAAIAGQRRRDALTGTGLTRQWIAYVQTGRRIRGLAAALVALLLELEGVGKSRASTGYVGDDRVLRHASIMLERLRVDHVRVFQDSPPNDQPRILVTQHKQWSGSSQSLPDALEEVFARGDNQMKLATANADERHLYVFIEDSAPAAVLSDGRWPPPPCPSDPEGVIDALWVLSVFDSGYIFRVSPGSSDWLRFVAATGRRAHL